MKQQLIPVVREALSDLETPLSTYRKLADCPNSFLLESVEGGERWGRYSIIGLAAREQICVQGGVLEHRRDGALVSRTTPADPLQWIADYAASVEAPDLPDLPRLNGGLVGYFGADTVRMIEPRLAGVSHEDTVGSPDILLLRADELVVFDNLRGRLHFVILCEPEQQAAAEARIDELMGQMAAPLPPEAPWHFDEPEALAFESRFGEDGFKAGVERIREYILAGDIYQANLSRRWQGDEVAADCMLDAYAHLRQRNAASFAASVQLPGLSLASASPERLFRLQNDWVETRPIAGTRPRHADAQRDQAMIEELLAHPKERAEHIMLVDLERHDMGRICTPGSVEVNELLALETYASVHHIVSNIRGHLRPGIRAHELFAALFPGGTITGCPKLRCMQVIHELEQRQRGSYTGSLGYISDCGQMDFNILIRTLVWQNGRVHIDAGAGIVADSQAHAETAETQAKADGLLRVLEHHA